MQPIDPPDLVRVVKVGGSLFDWPNFVGSLRTWTARQPTGPLVYVAGGGGLANVIRRFDQNHGIGAEKGHWLCVQLLDVTAQLLADEIPNATLVRKFESLRESLATRIPQRSVLSVEDFLRVHEPSLPGIPLPRDWRTTTDSIAARLAVAIDADELVLLKSCEYPAGLDRQAAQEKSLVDDAFSDAADGLKIRWVNLRRLEDPERLLPPK